MTNPHALENITVLDLNRVIASPFSGSILGDLDANVIKIGTPGKGDGSRAYAPHLNGERAYYAKTSTEINTTSPCTPIIRRANRFSVSCSKKPT